MNPFLETILAEMNKQGVTRYELAKRMGVMPPQIYKILGSGNGFTYNTMVRMCDALNLELKFILEKRL